MQTLPKPENAIKRADELRTIGEDDAALKVMHSLVVHRRFKNQVWDVTLEKLMNQFLSACCALNRVGQAREGLHQYRAIAHHGNTPSLGKVTVAFRDEAERRLQESQEQMKKMAEINEKEFPIFGGVGEEAEITSTALQDLDAALSPHSLLLSFLNNDNITTSGEGGADSAGVQGINPTSISQMGRFRREYVERLRFLWEVYKMILDLLRATPKLERVYHETARKAFLFCKEQNRTQEFRRLGEVVRSHYSILLKNKHKPEMESLLRVDYHLETKLLHLQVACHLNMWRESMTLIEEIHDLGLFKWFYRMLVCNATSKFPKQEYQPAGAANTPSPTFLQHVYNQTLTLLPVENININDSGQELTRASNRYDSFLNHPKTTEKLCRWTAAYMEKIAKNAWLAGNHLIHSLALIKYVLHVKTYKTIVSNEEMETIATTATLTILCISLNIDKEFNFMDNYEELPDNSGITALDDIHRMTQLLYYPEIPSRESLKAQLESKGIFKKSNNTAQKLYVLMERHFEPLQLCRVTLPLLQELNKQPAYSMYISRIKELMLQRLILNLSKFYKSLSLSFFSTVVCPKEFMEWKEAEIYIARFVLSGCVSLKINHSNGFIVFCSEGNEYLGVLTDIVRTTEDIVSRKLVNISHVEKKKKALKDQNEWNTIIEHKDSLLAQDEAHALRKNKENEIRRQKKYEEELKQQERKRVEEEEQKQLEERIKKLRKEEAIRIREETRVRDEQIRQKLETATKFLDEINKLFAKTTAHASKNFEMPKVYIQNKPTPISAIKPSDIVDKLVDIVEVEKIVENHVIMERVEITRQRRAEKRRLEHYVRACQMEQLPLLIEWSEKIKESDLHELSEHQKVLEKESEENIKRQKKIREILQTLLDPINTWKTPILGARMREYNETLATQRENALSELKTQKIQRAIHRRTAAIAAKQVENEEAKRLEALAAVREKQAEEQLSRQKLDDQAAKQRQKEKEVEEKYIASKYANNEETALPSYSKAPEANHEYQVKTQASVSFGRTQVRRIPATPRVNDEVPASPPKSGSSSVDEVGSWRSGREKSS